MRARALSILMILMIITATPAFAGTNMSETAAADQEAQMTAEAGDTDLAEPEMTPQISNEKGAAPAEGTPQEEDPATNPDSDPGTDPGQPPVYDGWTVLDGNTYYFEENVPVTGLRTIDGALYYFSDTGIMQTGKATIGKKLYYFNKDGKALKKKGWVKCSDGVKRYGKGNGTFVNGPKKIGKKLYLFSLSGVKFTKEKGFFNYNGKTYYSKGKGVLATGYQAITVKKKLNGYYFSKKTGAMAKDTTIGHLRIPKNGKLHKAYALGIRKLNSTKWTLRQAYLNSIDMTYAGREWRQKTSERYALRGFQTKRGNCYVMAAMFYVQAKLLGYDVHQVEGMVVRTHPHSWTVIYQGGKTWVYDPNFENETFRNGWKLYYGKKGTWRYTNRHVMN